jgi:hypothetical protein
MPNRLLQKFRHLLYIKTYSNFIVGINPTIHQLEIAVCQLSRVTRVT